MCLLSLLNQRFTCIHRGLQKILNVFYINLNCFDCALWFKLYFHFLQVPFIQKLCWIQKVKLDKISTVLHYYNSYVKSHKRLSEAIDWIIRLPFYFIVLYSTQVIIFSKRYPRSLFLFPPSHPLSLYLSLFQSYLYSMDNFSCVKNIFLGIKMLMKAFNVFKWTDLWINRKELISIWY